MPVSYSKDLRERVIMAWEAKEGSQRQLAQRFKVSLSFVRNILRQYRVNGQIEAKRRGGYQKPTIQNEHLGFIQSLQQFSCILTTSFVEAQHCCAFIAWSIYLKIAINTVLMWEF
ncbi:hypothetical protein [Nostoc sp.]|uniref:hypothetical protein n=1 Tax=Nostoc sp. TaxID=1180 RepID=UPI002FF620B1